MKDDLQRFVLDGEPPMGLHANDIISKGRRQRHVRLGLGLGTGALASALAFSSVFLLLPPGGEGTPPFGFPTPSASGTVCALPAVTPTASPTPTVAVPPATEADKLKTRPVYDFTAWTSGTGSDLSCFMYDWMKAQLPQATAVPDKPWNGVPPYAFAAVTSDGKVSYESETHVGDGRLFITVCHESERPRPADVPQTGFAHRVESFDDGAFLFYAWTGTTYFQVAGSSPVTPEMLMGLVQSPKMDVFK